MEQQMCQKRSVIWMAGLIAFAAAGAGANAAPASTLIDPELRAAVLAAVETVAYRRCRWYEGQRVCRWYRSPRAREYGIPENYRTGSNYWWQEMDRSDRGGRGARR
jgi:hypothetical protein